VRRAPRRGWRAVTTGDLVAILPFVALAGGACLVLLADLMVRADGRAWASFGAAIALGTAVVAVVAGAGDDGFGGEIRRDGAATFLSVLIAASTGGALLLASTYVGP